VAFAIQTSPAIYRRSRQDALSAVDGASMDNDGKAFVVELPKPAEQAQELTTA
jgi:hypothetical protein